jgi:hypothetical protein
MQPLKTTLMPRSASIMGCWDFSDRSRILNRLCPKPTLPRTTMPEASGPLGARMSAIFEIAETDGVAPSNLTSPQIPHIKRVKTSMIKHNKQGRRMSYGGGLHIG